MGAVNDNNFNLDVFGRTKVSNPFTLFDSGHRYAMSDQYSIETSGGGSYTHRPNESALDMSVGTASGDRATMESFRVFPYQPGKSLQILQSFTFGSPKENLRQRVGYFSRQNGIFLQQHGNEYAIVKRSYVTGSVVDTVIPQSSWNIDPMNGSGQSSLKLDFTQSQLMFIEIEWLGVGSVRVGFAYDGQFITAHRFDHANKIRSTYMTTATLPVRYEIENTGVTSSASEFTQICATVISNGGYEHRTPYESATRTSSVSTTTSYKPLVAIRLASGRTDAVAVPTAVSVLPTTNDLYEYALIKNPASLTATTWTAYGNGNVEYNIDGTAMSGGTIVRQGMVSSSNQSTPMATFGDQIQFDLQLGRSNASTPVSDVYVLAIRNISGTGTAYGSMSWINV